MFQKKISILLLTTVVATGSSISVAAAEGGSYPPMSERANTMPPPPPAGYNRAYTQNVPQQYSRPAAPQYAPRYPAPQGAYGGPMPYGRPAPYGGGVPYGARPGPWSNGGFNRGPWGGNRGFGNNGPFGNWFGGNRGPYGGNNGPFGNMFGGNNGPYGNNGPMGNMFGRNGIWGMHPDEWVTGNPEDGFSYMWDDMINAPSEMGEMPGGWNAPSISMPNPVDVGSEFRRETPNLIREIPDMININGND